LSHIVKTVPSNFFMDHWSLPFEEQFQGYLVIFASMGIAFVKEMQQHPVWDSVEQSFARFEQRLSQPLLDLDTFIGTIEQLQEDVDRDKTAEEQDSLLDEVVHRIDMNEPQADLAKVLIKKLMPAESSTPMVQKHSTTFASPENLTHAMNWTSGFWHAVFNETGPTAKLKTCSEKWEAST